jgi:hypothetical protein
MGHAGRRLGDPSGRRSGRLRSEPVHVSVSWGCDSTGKARLVPELRRRPLRTTANTVATFPPTRAFRHAATPRALPGVRHADPGSPRAAPGSAPAGARRQVVRGAEPRLRRVGIVARQPHRADRATATASPKVASAGSKQVRATESSPRAATPASALGGFRRDGTAVSRLASPTLPRAPLSAAHPPARTHTKPAISVCGPCASPCHTRQTQRGPRSEVLPDRRPPPRPRGRLPSPVLGSDLPAGPEHTFPDPVSHRAERKGSRSARKAGPRTLPPPRSFPYRQ